MTIDTSKDQQKEDRKKFPIIQLLLLYLLYMFSWCEITLVKQFKSEVLFRLRAVGGGVGRKHKNQAILSLLETKSLIGLL